MPYNAPNIGTVVERIRPRGRPRLRSLNKKKKSRFEGNIWAGSEQTRQDKGSSKVVMPEPLPQPRSIVSIQ